MSNHERIFVSVVMPVHNAERFLRQAIDSVLNQTYQNIELIAVDDCSNDNSFQILTEYQEKDHRVRVIKEEKNQGVAHARNKGIGVSRGEFIALIDSDDVWLETKLERQVSLLKKSSADLAYCSSRFIDENDELSNRTFIVPETTDFSEMLTKCVFTCSAVIVKAEILKEYPFKHEYYHEDYLLWMELMRLSVKAVGDPEILLLYRRVTGSRSNNKAFAAKQRWRIYRKALGLSFFRSCFTFIRYAVNGILKYYL